jgi:GNAT superfamily N-acetyltransferase
MDLNALIERSARQLSAGYYTSPQIEAAIRYVFGVDTRLVDDQTYYAVSEGEVLVAAKIRAFFVAPEHARHGIGRLLLETCVDTARRWGFSRLELMATLPGVALYSAMGFQPVRSVTDVLPDGTSIEFVQMERPV